MRQRRYGYFELFVFYGWDLSDYGSGLVTGLYAIADKGEGGPVFGIRILLHPNQHGCVAERSDGEKIPVDLALVKPPLRRFR